MNKVYIFTLCLLLLSCAENRIDSSSDDSFKKSIETVKSSLTDDKKKDFEEAIQAIALSQIGNIFEATANPTGMERNIKDKLSGKTADEIIADGNLLIIERKKKEHAQVISEIEEVKKKIAELKERENKIIEDRENLKAFKVVRSRFYYRKESYSTKPIVELTVRNETSHPISRAYFDGVLSTPNRSVPWVKDSFSYQIRGGLEPGEETTWWLAPNQFGEWGKAPKDRKDMVLTVTVIRIDGPDEKPIFSSEVSELDKKQLEFSLIRMDNLMKSLAKLEKELI